MKREVLGFVALGATSLLAACAASTGDTAMNGAGGNTSATTTASGAGGAPTTTTTGSGGQVSVGVGGATGAGGSTAPPIVYASTNTTLYRIDPTSPSLTPTKIGDFDCIGTSGGLDTSMTDVAVNQKGDLWGVSSKAAHQLEIQGSTVHCSADISLQNPTGVKFYGLSFVPAGILDPQNEVLLAGNTAGELWEIDGQGNLTLHGNFGKVPSDDGNGHSYKYPGTRWELSGDIVFLSNNGSPVAFATVRDCPSPPQTSSCDQVDTLIELDVQALKTATTGSVTKAVRGQLVKASGCNDGISGPYGGMYGIAAWNAQVYGFSHSGNVVTIDNNDGSTCAIGQYSNDLWSGAGITTVAPVVPPQPK